MPETGSPLSRRALLAAALAPPAHVSRIEELPPPTIVTLRAPLEHVQGIDTDGARVWVSSIHRPSAKAYVHVFSLPQGRLLRQVELQRDALIHPGGICLNGESSLWVPLAEYKRESRALILELDRDSLAIRSSFEVRDHIGCVAASPAGIHGGNWDSDQIYTWTRQGLALRQQPNASANAFQDLKFDDGLLIGSGKLRRQTGGAIDWLDPSTLRPKHRVLAGKTDRGVVFTNEGMAVYRGVLYLLPEDGPDPRLFLFKLQ